MTWNLESQISAISGLGKIGVLCGGQSAERDVSLNSGEAVYRALAGAGADVVKLDVTDDALGQIQKSGIDAAFIALHGAAGEDGRIQALLEFLEIPYTGSGVMASAIAMDKWRTKLILTGMNIPTPESCLLYKDTDWNTVVDELGVHLMIKPATEGSSLGMSKVHSVEALPEAFSRAHQYDQNVFAERVIEGEEYTVAILNGTALPAIRLETQRDFYDYEAKYLADDTLYHCPCGLQEADEILLQELAIKAFDAVGCKGWGRVDFMRDETGQFYVLEINTAPGMTDHSLVPMSAKQAGYPFVELIAQILAPLASSQESRMEA